ncbi:hypothetical protein BJV78DRAFT_488497 [Lactifluus subvellereus]|nr:hypothetical protein BJV78DRAFT_488497 [Lactifluus subvellereus]
MRSLSTFQIGPLVCSPVIPVARTRWMNIRVKYCSYHLFVHVLAFAMRSTTVFSLLAASLTLLSQTPAVVAAPVPSQRDLAQAKRCGWEGCRIAEIPPSDPVNESQSTLRVSIDGLIAALTVFMNSLPTDSTPAVDLAFSEPETQPGLAASAGTEVDPAAAL